MAKKPHPFEQLTKTHEYHERMAARAVVAFEEGKVNYLLNAFHMNAKQVGRTLRNAEESERGRPDLTFRAFNDTYQSFPLLLGASRLDGATLHTDPRAMLPALFKDFGSVPFVTAYELFFESSQERAGHRKMGLVFPRKGFKNGLIIYAADGLDDIPVGERETVLTYVAGKKKERHMLIVRSYQRVLEAIHNKGHGWRPEQG